LPIFRCLEIKMFFHLFWVPWLAMLLIKAGRSQLLSSVEPPKRRFFAPAGCSLFGWSNGTCAKKCVLEYLWFVKKRIQYVCCIKSKGTYPFVINELRLEPKFREVGRARFNFWLMITRSSQIISFCYTL
jgi:hypothetical protein